MPPDYARHRSETSAPSDAAVGTSPVTLVHAKDHPVLADASSWSVAEVQLHYRGLPLASGHVVVTLVRDRQRRRLEFPAVADFTMTAAFTADPSPLRILDVTHLQWSGVAVRVESRCGGLGFWAASASSSRAPAAPRSAGVRRRPAE